jgi:murein DD-endopeptidase MepM/ murein hydrolase activator NlpD
LKNIVRFIFISHDNRTSKEIRIPKVLIYVLSVLSVFLLLASIIVLYDYVSLLKSTGSSYRLSAENRELKEQIKIYKIKTQQINKRLEKIEIFRDKLKNIFGIPTKEETSNNDSKLQEELYNSYVNRYKKLNIPLVNDSILLQTIIDIDIHFLKNESLSNNLFLDFNLIDNKMLDDQRFASSTPSVAPASGIITSQYGPRISPYFGVPKMHEGLDIGAGIGTNVIATADGTVSEAENSTGFGKVVKIDHGYGIETLYAHNSQLLVNKGQVVQRGTLIAKSGNTGWSTGPHVHYEIRVNGIAIDPQYYILNDDIL